MNAKNPRDSYGFRFWLGWILWFAGSLVLVSVLWTGVISALFGKIQGPELVFLWGVSVFGSWAILLTPFMRKKEQIWKRLNYDEERSVDLWLLGMGIFIGLLIASCLGWSLFFKERILQNPLKARLDGVWAKAVFGSWIFLLMPFLVFMYRKADQIFKEAVSRQSAAGPRFRTLFLEKSKRRLPEKSAVKIKNIPPTLREGHLVNLILKDGRKIANAFVLHDEILGVYDRLELGFDVQDISDIEPLEEIPVYEESKWLRLDARV
ncbi:MAG: hypothetical protein HYZ84_02100 [Candidatus Omnitrophica bacterium]|nr:hypothetical protein [Candidatus Omnitrophota bacterium]